MRLVVALLLGMSLSPTAAVAAEATDALTEAERRFQGVWDYSGYPSGHRSGTLRIEGREFVADVVHGRYRGHVAIRPDTIPAQIDFTIEDCDCTFDDGTAAGIFYYEEDGAIVFATPAPGEPRPTTFTDLDEATHEIARLTVGRLVAGSPSIATDPNPDTSRGAQLFEGLGDYHREFTTGSEQARRYLDQGMTWLQSFNYDEAERSFRQAARLDPDCAMAWWGVAAAAGPSYNHPRMTDRRVGILREGLRNARDRIGNTGPVERALIEALGARDEEPYPLEDDSHLDQAYADAMAEVWERFPEDADVGALYAEALMVRTPWALYDIDREPAEDTPMIEALLERVLELDPDHAGAAHLYIHAVELSTSPERGLVVADRLSTLVPLSGHMLHMPSHIYTRSGDWDRAIEQNALAMEADERYRALSPDQFTQHMYMAHNNHIRAYAAMMVGREAEALEASRRMWSQIPPELLEDVGSEVDAWMCSVYDVYKRFGRWDAMLAEPAPPRYMPFTLATWHAARAVSFAARKQFDAAEQEFRAYRRLRNNLRQEDLPDDYSLKAARGRLKVIDHFVPGEIALQRGKLRRAIRRLERARVAEDRLGYSGEPPDYLQPIRHTLGAVYLKAGRLQKAEAAYREDQAEFPGNGWSLYGLSRVLRAQGRTAEAEEVEEQFRLAWAGADGPIVTSCECVPEL